MTTFGRREVDRGPITHARPSVLTPRREEPSVGHSVLLGSLRERVLELIDPSEAASVPRDGLRRQIEEIIHGIANKEKLELSGREQAQLADIIADDMTGYGPLQPLLMDQSISDIMVNAPNNVYVERKGKLERVAVRFRDADHIATVAQKIASRVGRRVDESSPACATRALPGREPRQYHLAPAVDRQSYHLNP